MKHNRKYQNKEWLKREYLTKNRTLKDITKECGVSWGIISTWVKKFNIKKGKINER